MEAIIHAIGNLVSNPIAAVCIVVGAVILGKILAVSWKILKFIILIGIVYVAAVSLGFIGG